MSMDITLESVPEGHRIDFDHFAHKTLASTARAVAVAVGDPTTAAAAMTAATRLARRDWETEAVSADPGRFIFKEAIAVVIAWRAATAASELGPLPPLLGPACTVAYFELGWSVASISSALELSPEAVEHHLELARTHGIANRADQGGYVDVQRQVRELIAQADPELPNVRRISRRHRWNERLSKLRTRGLIGAGLLIVLVLLAQLVSRPTRVADEPVASPNPPAAPAASTSSGANAAAGEVGNEPRPELVPRPEIITTDGQGGFVGVRSTSPQNAQVVFTRSSDGTTWSPVSRWRLGPYTSIDRFERSGDYYMAWISGVATSSADVVATVGITRDLIAWTVVELSLDDNPPTGLVYEAEISGLSVSGDNILALVSTNVDIDFDVMSIDEGHTCDPAERKCDTVDLDVLSLSEVGDLPARTRLFISRGGQPFEQIAVPFGHQTAGHLTTVNGMFAITDETGVRFATSTDGIAWKTISAGKPPFPVRAAATYRSGQVVGVGELRSGQTVLFHNDGQTANTSITHLPELIGTVSEQVDAIAAAAPDYWVIYLFEPHTNAWLLGSADGVDWTAVPMSAPAGESPRMLVGNNEAVVQWTGSDGAITTLAIPLR